MEAAQSDWVSITMVHSADDGGWYGEVFASRLGRPGQQLETEIFASREQAASAAKELADQFPGLRRVVLDDIN